MGGRVLGVSVTGDNNFSPNITVHAWCSSAHYSFPAGSVSLAWVNSNVVPITVEQVSCTILPCSYVLSFFNHGQSFPMRLMAGFWEHFRLRSS